MGTIVRFSGNTIDKHNKIYGYGCICENESIYILDNDKRIEIVPETLETKILKSVKLEGLWANTGIETYKVIRKM